MKKNITMKENFEDKIFNFFNISLMVLVLLVVSYPVYFVCIASISDTSSVVMGEVVLFPKKITFEGYKRILIYKDIWMGYGNTLFYTAAGTFLNLALTLTGAYALSRKDMPGRNLFMGILAFTMFFGGGLIPTYLLVKGLNLVNTYAVLIILGAVSIRNLIIARTFFQSSIPDEMREAATIDGCNDFQIFFRIVLPLSSAIVAVLGIYYAVGHWNQYFNGLIYLRDRTKYPLQLILREILIQDQFNEELQIMDKNAENAMRAAMSMKYGVIIVASLPMLALYPFVQKYFVKGVMVGAIKG